MFDFSAFRTMLTANSPAFWLAWLALLAFGVTLIVMFRTRWRNANAILRCVVLSLYVHMILVMAAYGTRMWFGSSSGETKATISVRLLDDAELDAILAEAAGVESNTDRSQTPTSAPPDIEVQETPLDRRNDSSETDIPTDIPTDNGPSDVVGAANTLDADPDAPTSETELSPSEPARDDDSSGSRYGSIDDSETDPVARAPLESEPPEYEPPEFELLASELLASEPPEHEPLVPEPVDSEPLDSEPLDSEAAALEPIQIQPTELIIRPESTDPAVPFAGTQIARPDEAPHLVGSRDPVVSSPTVSSPTQSIRHPIALPRDPLAAPGSLQSRPLPNAHRVDIRTQARQVANRVEQPLGRPARYGQRTAERQRQALIEILGRDDALASVQEALQWLKSHQESDGSWNPQRHGGGRETHTEGHNRRGAGINADTGMTGLALLAFAGAGHDHTQGEYRDTIGKAIAFLIAQQRDNGDLSGEASLFAAMYCHGMAALALAELLAYSGDEQLRGPVEKAVQYTIRSQDPNTGSWRYAAGDGQGDMSQFGWQVMVLTTAELSGISVPETTRYRMSRFVDQMSTGRDGGLSRYQRGHRPSRTMTAESLVCRQFLAIDVPTSAEREGFEFIGQERPGQGSPNLYYWYYGSLAQMQYRSAGWQTWVKEMEATLIARQVKRGAHEGSWSPNTQWGGYGGRVYSTALAALCLEVFYRYDRESADSNIPHWTRQDDGRWGPLRR